MFGSGLTGLYCLLVWLDLICLLS